MQWKNRVARRIKLRELQMLQAVAQTGSMMKAAASLAVSQSAISKSIAEMEHTLGMPLFDRTARGVVPTPCARVLLKRGAAIFDELRQGIEEIEFLADPTAGELRIGTTEPMAAILSAAIERLSRRYPLMVFHVTVGDTGILLRDLRDRNLDLAITRMVATDAESDIEVETLFHDRLAVIAGQTNPLTTRRKLTLHELINEPWTLPPPDNFLSRFIAESFLVRGLELPRATVITPSIHMRNSLLAAGRFITMLPNAVLRFPGYRGFLKGLPVQLKETTRPIGLIRLKKRELGPAADLFLQAVRLTASTR